MPLLGHTPLFVAALYTNLAQLTVQKTTLQTFQSFQSTTQNEAWHLYFDLREFN